MSPSRSKKAFAVKERGSLPACLGKVHILGRDYSSWRCTNTYIHSRVGGNRSCISGWVGIQFSEGRMRTRMKGRWEPLMDPRKYRLQIDQREEQRGRMSGTGM